MFLGVPPDLLFFLFGFIHSSPSNSGAKEVGVRVLLIVDSCRGQVSP